jgi:molybdenum cofactor biosynthesis enzyme
MEDVTHKQIYDRLVAVETKVDKIDQNTADVVAAFQNAKGAFIALDWLARFSGKILKIGAFVAAVGVAIVTIWEKWKS